MAGHRGQLWPFVALHSVGVITGDDIRRARNRRGLSRDALAKAIEASEKTISRIENGKSTRGAVFVRVVDYLGLSDDQEDRHRATPGVLDLSRIPDHILWTELQTRFFTAREAAAVAAAGTDAAELFGEVPPEAWEQDDDDGRTQAED
jgi:transcriptional regulator with XRE-family HTH domain